MTSITTVADPNWHIVGMGDFNADGKPDILWRTRPPARMTVWYMNGAMTSSANSPPLPIRTGPSWVW